MGLGSTFKFYPDDVSAISVEQPGIAPPVKTIAYNNPSKRLGDGFNFSAGISYIVNDFINVGLDFVYFRSTIHKYRDSSVHITGLPVANNPPDEYIYNEYNIISYAATLLSLTPNITFKAISRPKWFLFNRLGMVFTFRPNSLQEDMTETMTSLGWQGFYHDSAGVTLKNMNGAFAIRHWGLWVHLGDR